MIVPKIIYYLSLCRASSSEMNQNLNENAKTVKERQQKEHMEEDDAPQSSGLGAFLPYVVILITIIFMKVYGPFGKTFWFGILS